MKKYIFTGFALLLLVSAQALAKDTIQSLCVKGCWSIVDKCLQTAVGKAKREISDGVSNPQYDPKINLDKEINKCMVVRDKCLPICRQSKN
jgi:hypothetical protein